MLKNDFFQSIINNFTKKMYWFRTDVKKFIKIVTQKTKKWRKIASKRQKTGETLLEKLLMRFN